MATTRYSIQMNYSNAIKRAEQLENIAKELDTMAKNKLDSTLQSISASWKSESANRYLKKGHTLEDRITQTAKELRNTAKTIRNTATRIRNADLYALELAEKREG
ncbi:MAG: WXG100 family type VII secretion target [Lachnospiraceae bacterium]|nr:WXG100 family type VII secretion target [Lachnospiraceae bacterium]